MPSSFKIGKIAGIEIGVHWSWIFILVLITWSFADGILHDAFPEWSQFQRWAVGVVVAGIFFASILLHELSHSLVAKSRGMPVKGITLFVFGGVSNLGREAESASEEFWIAIVGPLTSLGVGAFFAIIWAVLQGPAPGVAAVAGYLAFINAVIAAFNMLPGFPLDGGRVFRSIVWARNRNLLRATRIASNVGQFVAFALMAGGAAQLLLFGYVVGGLWMFLIGLFLRSASTSSYQQLMFETALRGVSVAELARSDYRTVPPDITVAELVDQHMLVGGGRCYPVMAGEELLGLVTLTDVRKLEREQWPATAVFHVMTPFERLRTVSFGEDARQLLQLMSEADLNQVPVVEGRRLLGIVTRADILHLIQLRREVALED